MSLFLDNAKKELEIIERIVSDSKVLDAQQAGLLFGTWSVKFDNILKYSAASSSSTAISASNNEIKRLLFGYIRALQRLGLVLRLSEGPIAQFDHIRTFSRAEVMSYIELYALICTKRSKYVILDFILKKSAGERQILLKYYLNHASECSKSQSRDAIYQTCRLHLSAKIYALTLFGFLRDSRSEMVNGLARYIPFETKFGYREKFFSSQKILEHKNTINGSILGKVDADKVNLVLPAGNKTLNLVGISTDVLSALDGKEIIATGTYDGKDSLTLDQYPDVGECGWIFEFFGISSQLEPSTYSRGNPIIELI